MGGGGGGGGGGEAAAAMAGEVVTVPQLKARLSELECRDDDAAIIGRLQRRFTEAQLQNRRLRTNSGRCAAV